MVALVASNSIDAGIGERLWFLQPISPQNMMEMPMRVNQLWTSIADAGRDLLRGRLIARKATAESLAADLLSTRGDAVGMALARELVDLLGKLSDEDQLAFLQHLASHLEPDGKWVIDAAETYKSLPSPDSLRKLRQATEAPRQELFRRINMAPNGIRSLVSLREFLLRNLREQPELSNVDADLHELLTSWLNPGFLSLVQIDWNSPTALLEKLILYEKVHRIPSLEALKRRLGPDRRCFAFFHPALPDEPLIFVQVALVKGMASKVQPLIEPSSELGKVGDADTAIFYSISNCQDGLRGVSLGNFLIKLVVGELARDLPALRTYATLSPVPGFMRWLAEAVKNQTLPGSDGKMLERLSDLDWIDDEGFANASKARLEALCAHYLVLEKRRSEPRDAVARFHLNNGARLERINWLGDISEKGLKESAGILVNYRYDPASIEKNHEAFANEGTVVTSSSVRSLIKPLDNGDS